MGHDLVLQARLGLLRSSLLTVESAIKRIEKARRLAVPADAPSDASTSLSASVGAAIRVLRGFLDRVEAVCDVGEARESLRRLEAARDAAHVKNPWGGLHLALDKTSVESDLKEDVRDRLDDLDAIEATLRNAEQANDKEHEDLLREAWQEYTKVDAQCGNVFGEYVDLVRGVLLRDAGLDHDLCRIADELPSPWKRISEYDWRSFTIPAAHDWRGMSAARLIRIGFPEWSIWSLPLTAHEFGHVFAAKHKRMQSLQDEILRSGWASAAEVSTWVADVFATVALGPAYVWAAMLLRADPASRLDNERVMIMLETLRAIAPHGAYADECEAVKTAWEQARARVDSDSTGLHATDELVARIVAPVHRRVAAAFNASRWERATELADKLTKPDVTDKDPLGTNELIKDLGKSDLRDLLVAAWQARLRVPNYGPDQATAVAAMERDRLDGLAERTRLACIALIDETIPTGQVTPAQRLAETAPLGKPQAKSAA